MATIAEKSRTKDIIDRLQSILDTASPVPLASGKVTIYKDEVQSLLTELASQIEIELKTYHEVNDRKGKIINEAKKEAEKIIYEAEHSASRMRVNKRTTNVAPINYEELTEEERGALTNANEIYGASLIYTDEMLNEVNQLIETAYQNIQTDYQTILQNMEQKMNIIAANRAELMDGLQEMDTADRSQQIIEIGHLLSDELYNARLRNHVGGEQYDDGSVQLSMDFQQMQEERARAAEERAEQATEQALAAEAKSAQAENALANMMAERDALALKVAQIQKEKDALANTIQNAATTVTAATQTIAEAAAAEDDEEYEIVYVTEDELEEGEEYEIEYVDEDELEEGEEYEIEYVEEEDDAEVDTAADTEMPVEEEVDVPGEKMDTATDATEETTEQNKSLRASTEPQSVGKGEKNDKDTDEIIVQRDAAKVEKDEVLPLIPHFKKSEKITSVPSERISKMADTVTTDPKYRGLISRAVENKKTTGEQTVESVAAADTVLEQERPNSQRKRKRQGKQQEAVSSKNTEVAEKDADIKKDENGQEYVQATMKFDEDFEIMEF